MNIRRPRLILMLDFSDAAGYDHSYSIGVASGSQNYSHAWLWLWINWGKRMFRFFGTKHWRKELRDFPKQEAA